MFTAGSVVEYTNVRVAHLILTDEHKTRNVTFLGVAFGGEVFAKAFGGDVKSKTYNYLTILLLLLVITFLGVFSVTTCLRILVAAVLGRCC